MQIPPSGVREAPHTDSVLSADLLVLGGGLAGLSAIEALSRVGYEGRIHMVEPRAEEEYRRDRTWCMWDVGDNPYAHLATHRWSSWVVRDERKTVRARYGRHPYLCIPSDRFYAHALRHVESAQNVTASFRDPVESVVSSDDGVLVRTRSGTVRAALALDSRPESMKSGSWLLQSFVGWEIETDHDVFDVDAVTLMDFRLREPGKIEFFYILPYSPNRALVESTEFSLTPSGTDFHEARLERYVRELLRTRVRRVDYREVGVLPMRLGRSPEPSQPNVLPIGLRGGLAKPSTGYAFLRIQRDSERLAEAIAAGEGSTPRRVAEARSDVLDRIFLSFLRNRPELAPSAFLELFARVEPATLVAFLSESGGLQDDARVVTALPSLPLLEELGREAWGVFRPLSDQLRHNPSVARSRGQA